MENFGTTIAHYRKKLGVSQRKLARSIKVAPSYLNEIENSQRGAPSERIVRKLAEELQAPVEAFLDAAARENLLLPADIAPHIRKHPEVLELLRTVARNKLPKYQIDEIRKRIERGFVKTIILAAGMGTRMKHMTKDLPKCLAIQFQGKSLLETQIETLKSCGVKDIVVVRGYQGKKIDFPDIRTVWNDDYENNNILESLFCATEELEGDVIISYSDIWYEESVLKKLLRSDKDIAIGVDIDWKDYYAGRKDHPIEEAENVIFDSNNQVIKIGKIGASGEEVHGEFIGMVKLTHRGCQLFKEHFKRAKSLFDGKKYQRAKEFKKAYITDLLQDMADLGVSIHCEIIGSQWKEIDTIEDFENAVKSLENMKRKTTGE